MTRRIAMTLVFCLLAFRAFAGDEHQAISDFVRANDFYKNGQYAQAIEAYEKALKEGFESGPLYYNLANSYYRSGQTGRAVLNYERARQLMPRDRDLKFNANYLAGRYPDLRQSPPSGFLNGIFEKHNRFYTLDEMTLLMFGFLVVLGLFVLVAYVWRLSRTMVVSICGFLGLGFLVFLTGFLLKTADLKGAAVVVEKTSANFEPRKEATAHYSLNEGSRVTILKTEDGWAKVRRWDKKLGWVPASSVELIAAQ